MGFILARSRCEVAEPRLGAGEADRTPYGATSRARFESHLGFAGHAAGLRSRGSHAPLDCFARQASLPRSAALQAGSFVAFGETERRVSPNAPALAGAQRL
ncbi:hypothetical protein GCM10022236_22600 [Microlunatus ginsengisoli]|uniref:Uncharacterized protein n=1 Tax=Microlunatus ginsengisoli TaxID=363863 RepID=A0ABP6ZXV8_9ACTN